MVGHLEVSNSTTAWRKKRISGLFTLGPFVFPDISTLRQAEICSREGRIARTAIMVILTIMNSRVRVQWYKQWKSRRRCLDRFALGRSQGKSDFPERRSPRESLNSRRTSCGQICQTMPKAFPLFSQTSGFKNRRGFRLCLGTVWI